MVDGSAARFHVMRQLLHFFCGAVFLPLSGTAPPQRTPEFRSFHDLMWTGRIDVADGINKRADGQLHWERFLQNTPTGRFHAALRLLAENDPGTSRLLPAMRAE